MEKGPISPTSDSLYFSASFDDPLALQTTRTRNLTPRLQQPWRHSISKRGPPALSRTVREFKPRRQRWRLFVQAFLQWLITVAFCGLLAACLYGFASLRYMQVSQIKTFNALIVLFSMFLGNNLTSSLREYALMLRWRILAANYRNLDEFDLIMHCESIRKVMKLFWVARSSDQHWLWLNKTQWLCVVWVGVNVLLQLLVALLGLTYNLNTSNVPLRTHGNISIANFTLIRDIWGADNPSFGSQLGSANSYGIQGQDYNFVNGTTVPGQGRIASWGTPGIPTIYANDDWTNMTYFFQDTNPVHPEFTLLSHRNVTVEATCQQFTVTDGGDGIKTFFSYIDEHNQSQTLDAVRVGPGAMTYIGMLNSTCGARCAEIMALQSADGQGITLPSFYKCRNSLSHMTAIDEYLVEGQTRDMFEIPDQQAWILAGAIGWTGFNFTADDFYQYVRYATDTWWSPNTPTDPGQISRRIMEFSIEAVAAFDYNGPKRNVTGWYPSPAQNVMVEWRWSAAILGVIPVIQLAALCCVIAWANTAIIRDASCLSTARLLRPIVDKLGEKGCLLSGKEIAAELSELRVKYGWREPGPDFQFRNEIDPYIVRHVDILQESEGFGSQGEMPPGRYDGLQSDDEEPRPAVDVRTRLLHRRRFRRTESI